MKKIEVLKTALTSRDEEIETYQINIDNYERAILMINELYLQIPEMVDFKHNLEQLLKSSKIEQLKSIIIRDVIKEQLEELGDS